MPSRRMLAATIALFAATGLAACSLASHPEQPAIMARSGITMPPEQLRLRTIQQAAGVLGIVELASDDILAEATDPAVRRNALLWKANMIPAIETSVVQFDPAVSLVDLLALCIQTDDFFRTGAGGDAFGPHQERARRATAQAIAGARALVQAIAPDSTTAARGDSAAVRWARDHPIESFAFARETMTTAAAVAITGGEGGALAAVGLIDQNLTNLNTRVAMLMAYLPKQIRWEVQLLTDPLLGGGNVDTALGDLGSLTRSVERITAVAESLPGLVDWQRRAALDAITAERVAVLHTVTAERIATLESIADQVTRLLGAITEERTATLRDVEAMLGRSVRQSQGTVDAAIDHLVWRLAELVAALLVLITLGLGVLVLVLKPRTAALPAV